MSLDKSIKHGKERRKQYRGTKAYDKTCRNHGSCDYCRNNRLHNGKKRLARIKARCGELTLEEKEVVGESEGTMQSTADELCERD